MAVTVEMREQVTQLYVALFDRAPDAEGLGYWVQQLAAGATVTDVANAMYGTEPARATYPLFLTNGEIVENFYVNVLGREPDAEGLAYWTAQLNDSTPGAVIAQMIDVVANYDGEDEAGLESAALFANKVEVAQYFAIKVGSIPGSAEALSGVTADPASVAVAKGLIDGGGVGGGGVYMLTAGTDRAPEFTGTAASDKFYAYISQNSFAGGVSNTLSSADSLDGGAGVDYLYAELVPEFFGATGDNQIDVQPRTVRIENVEFEARDLGLNDVSGIGGGYWDGNQWIPVFGEDSDDTVVVDAKYMWGVERIGSKNSDGDLVIENLTTLSNDGVTKRNTDSITITMDHTDNFNTDRDASDLHVYFDDNYLLSGQVREAQAFFFLLDEDADLVGNPNRLDRINVDGIRFSLDGGTTIIDLDDPEAQLAGTHQGFVNALQDELAELIANGTVPAGTTLTLDPTITDFTFLDNGQQSQPIPAIVLTIGDGTPVTPVGYSQVQDAIGEYDVYGRFNAEAAVADQPITSNIELHKVGRGGDGGDLVIGGKSQMKGVEVFNVDVLGDDSKPSNLGMLASTGGDLRIVNIATHADYVDGDSFASLTIRDGFGSYSDLQLVNADAFLGDLTLGNGDRVYNLDTLTAQGGGDVSFYGELTGSETAQAYSYTTGAGDDLIDLDIDGDALDYADSSLNISTGAGDDEVYINSAQMGTDFDAGNQRLNQAILKNAEIDTGAGNDYVELGRGSKGNFIIKGGAGDDFINTGGYGNDVAGWAFNFDNARVDDTNLNDGNDLPGVQTSLAYLGGATITVTLSGAGADGNDLVDGGGVMAFAAATARTNGYEASFTIGSLINGNRFYGDQRDVNAAVIAAIENDPVLSKLLEVRVAENNTLVIESTTSGRFDADDLRIDIKQADQTSWTAVQNEARSVFKNSGISVTSIATANDASPNDLTTSDNADMWWDGLSVAGTGSPNSATDNQFETGDASIYETDNVINGGDGDDLIVLSTDAATFGGSSDFTRSGNNKLQNLASNETIVMTGQNFGNDTIMNFTTDTEERTVPQAIFNLADNVVVAPDTDAEVSVVVIQNVLASGEDLEVTLTNGHGSEAVAAAIVAAVNSSSDLFTAEVVDDGGGSLDQIVFTGRYPVGSPAYPNGDDVAFTIEDRDTDTTPYTVVATFTPTSVGEGGTDVVNSTVLVDVDVARGLDFLDFTYYLTSQQDISSGAGDTSASNNLIPVTLDYNEDATASNNVEANEVVVVRMTDDATEGETFSALTASVVAGLFNDTADTDGEWGALTEANLNAATYQKTDQEALIGNAKAIFMVENGANLGEYKVFELTWTGDNASATGDVVSAIEIGSLDFGTSLTNLGEVNLIGSQAYADLDLSLFV